MSEIDEIFELSAKSSTNIYNKDSFDSIPKILFKVLRDCFFLIIVYYIFLFEPSSFEFNPLSITRFTFLEKAITSSLIIFLISFVYILIADIKYKIFFLIYSVLTYTLILYFKKNMGLEYVLNRQILLISLVLFISVSFHFIVRYLKMNK